MAQNCPGRPSQTSWTIWGHGVNVQWQWATIARISILGGVNICVPWNSLGLKWLCPVCLLMGMVCFSSPGQMNAFLEVWNNNVLTTTVVSYKSLIHQPVRRPVVIEAGPFDPDFQGCSLGGYTNKPAVTGFPVTVPILGRR